MTREQCIRYDAAHLLALQASGPGALTISQIASAVGYHATGPAIDLAVEAIRASIGAGTWREVRAEAEAKLHTGWQPTELVRRRAP